MPQTTKVITTLLRDRTEEIVYIVDDEAAVRHALQNLIESEGLAETCSFASAQEFLEACSPEMRGCILLDLSMPGLSGLELQKELARRHVSLPIIFLTGHGSVPATAEAFKSGAYDFIEKPFDNEVLLECLQQALSLERQHRAEEGHRKDILERYSRLSEREKQVLHYVVKGYGSKEIAKSLGISPRTIEIYRGNVMRKMKADTLAELVALTVNLVTPERLASQEPTTLITSKPQLAN